VSSRRKFFPALDSGVPQTGLTPSASVWLKPDGSAPTATAPTISEVGSSGYYTFEVPADLDSDVLLVVDCGAGISDPTERYVSFNLLLTDYGLGPLVKWAHPRGEPREGIDGGDEEGHYLFYVYLEGREGEPLTGVTAGDLEDVKVFGLEEMSGTIQRTVAPSAISWTEIGADFPGLYSFRLDNDNGGAGPVGGNDHLYASFRRTADTNLTHVWSAHTGGGGGGGNGGGEGGEETFFFGLIGVQLLLSGVNSKTIYTAFGSDGNPTAGRLDLYTDSEAVEVEDSERLISSVSLSYAYDGMGRLSSQSQTLDSVNQATFFAWLQSLLSSGGDGG
jgi:hypothetical protein